MLGSSSSNLGEKMAFPSLLWVVMKRFTFGRAPECAILILGSAGMVICVEEIWFAKVAQWGSQFSALRRY